MKREWLISLILVIVTLAVFIQVRHFDFVRYDDDRYVTLNRHVQSGLTTDNLRWAFTALHASNWHPVTWISHMADSELYDLNPQGHHLTSVFFHILNVLLLFLILRMMTGALWQSAFVAALFAVHPLHIESVAWVAERKDVLSTFFMMLTLWAYIRYVKRPGIARYIFVMFFFALALMSKPMVVTLPFVLLLVDYWPLKRFTISPAQNADQNPRIAESSSSFSVFLRLCREKIPLFILSIMSIAATLLAQRQEIAPLAKLSFSTRFVNALVAYTTYIEKMIWPQNLAVLYPYSETLPLWKVAAASIVLILITLLVIKGIRRFHYLATGWFWYLGTLVPVIGLVQVGAQSHADRYTYIPLIGLFIIIAWGIPDLMKKWRHRAIALVILAGLTITALSVVSWYQLAYWQNSMTLFSHTLRVTKDNYIIQSNMGAFLAEQGKFSEAVAHYEEALRIKSDDVDIRYNLANALSRQGKMKEAIAQYENVLKTDPAKAAAHNNLAIALAADGQADKAVEHFREALKIKPDYEDARTNLNKALDRKKKAREIRKTASTSKVIDATTADGQMRLAIAQLQKGNIDGAAAHFQAALKLNARITEAHLSLGLIMAKKQNLDAAAHHFREALKIDPRIAEAHNSLGVALAYQGKTEEATEHFREALKINPNFAKAHNSLAVILAQKGRTDDALDHLREALRIKPDYEDAKRNLKIISGTQP